MSIPEETTVITDVHNALPGRRTDDCLVLIYAHDADVQGRRFRLRQGPLRIGRLDDNHVVLGDDSVSRRHARIEGREDGWYVMDVGSANGTLPNDADLVGHAKLKNGDRIKVGKNIIKYLSGDDVETAYLEEIFQLTITDALTQVSNRRCFDETLDAEFSRARRYERPLSLLLVDVDHFKAVNDRYGHLAGDHVLRALSQLVADRFPEDTVARYGGEELGVILPETGLGRACVLAEQLRHAVSEASFTFRGDRLTLTASIGCAAIEPGDEGPLDLLARADAMVYRAKREGRNRVSG